MNCSESFKVKVKVSHYKLVRYATLKTALHDSDFIL